MTKKEVQLFMMAVGQAYWHMGYQQFCQKLDIIDCPYSKEKWEKWQALNEGLNAFDAESISKLIAK